MFSEEEQTVAATLINSVEDDRFMFFFFLDRLLICLNSVSTCVRKVNISVQLNWKRILVSVE